MYERPTLPVQENSRLCEIIRSKERLTGLQVH